MASWRHWCAQHNRVLPAICLPSAGAHRYDARTHLPTQESIMSYSHNPTRRGLIVSSAALAAGAFAGVAEASPQSKPKAKRSIIMTGNTITTEDGTQIYFKDWGEGPIVTFSHGWPLNADAWDGQMHFLAANGFRVIAHDRRGHGRSSQPSSGNDMNGYADDLAALIE